MIVFNQDIPVTFVINNYSELCDLLMIESPSKSVQIATTKALLAYKTKYSLPKSVRYHSATSDLIENLMFRAIQHWCCISFKIVPIELELLKKDTPKTILYCVAAISMVTTTTTKQVENHNKNKNKKRKVYDKSAEGFKKDVGFYFYERAVNYLSEILFEDEELSVIAIQCYFCLSYTSNLLRLTDEQRTWHYLACDLMKNKVNSIHVSPALKQCWYRWYYIDAWIGLSLNMECLLPDKLPFSIKRPSNTTTTITKSTVTTTIQTNDNKKHHNNCCLMSNDTLYEFVLMTQYMRRFNRCIQSNTLIQSYDNLTMELEYWWSNMQERNLHLSICYHSMRLVILYALLQQLDPIQVTFELLLDGLNITLEILQGLQELKLMKCDQSTYHHMFFAIHKTLKSILFHIKQNQDFNYLESFTRQQFEMNLSCLEGTDAYINDIYAMRTIGTMIENDLFSLGYIYNDEVTTTKRYIHVFRTIKMK